MSLVTNLSQFITFLSRSTGYHSLSIQVSYLGDHIMLKSTSIYQTTLTLLLLLSFSLPINALEGIPATLQVAGKNLILNGAGVRKKFIYSVYFAGLYLDRKNADAKHIIIANKPMAMRMRITSKHATVERVKKGFIQGFNNNAKGNAKSQINQFLKAGFSSKIANGDVFDFIYTPANGTQLIKNNKQLALIKGLPFKQALFSIWLSNKPTQSSLKHALLGK